MARDACEGGEVAQVKVIGEGILEAILSVQLFAQANSLFRIIRLIE